MLKSNRTTMFLSLFLLVLSLSGLMGCGRNAATVIMPVIEPALEPIAEPTGEPTKPEGEISKRALESPCGAAQGSIPASNPCIQYMGRCDFSDSTLGRFSWPGVVIEARFVGSRVTA